MTVWILTREINQYDQDGEYFEYVFREKPSILKLKALYPDLSDEYLLHIINKGGRANFEDTWYHLYEHQPI